MAPPGEDAGALRSGLPPRSVFWRRVSGRGQVWLGVWTLQTPWVPPRLPLVRVHPSINKNDRPVLWHAELTVPPALGLAGPGDVRCRRCDRLGSPL